MDRFLHTPTRLGEDARNPALATALGLLPPQTPTSPTPSAHNSRPGSPVHTPSRSPTRVPESPHTPHTPHGRRPHLVSESMPALFADPQSSPLPPPTSPLMRRPRGHSLQILPVSGVRENFYTTILCYEPHCDIYAIAMGESVSVWSEQLGGEPVGLPRTFGPVRTVAISSTGMLAVLYEENVLCIYNVVMQLYVAREVLRDDATTLAWPAEGDGHLYIGGARGTLTLYMLKHVSGRYCFVPHPLGRKHRDMICRIVVNPTGEYLVTTCGDGMLNVWEILENFTLKHKYGMPHKGSMRAVSFCPWSPYLVGSGGGRLDRQVRVWDVRVFQEFKYKFYVPGQVTSIVWLAKWDIYVSFGHDQPPPRRVLGAAYSLPANKWIQTFEHSSAYSLDAVPWGTHGACILDSRNQMTFFRWTPEENPPNLVAKRPTIGDMKRSTAVLR